MRIINQSQLDVRAYNFIKQVIKPYNIERLSSIKLSETSNGDSAFYGRFRYPKDRPWSIVASVHKDWKYPMYDYIAVGTETNGDKWHYVNVHRKFDNYEDAMLYVFFHEWFHYIRKTDQISVSAYGKNGEPSANKYSLDQVDLYKKGGVIC